VSAGILALLCAAFTAVPLLVRDPYVLDVGVVMLQSLMLTMSLRLMLSAGELNMAHVSFMAVGAYVSAALVMNTGISFWLALPASAMVATVVAGVVGGITLRVSGPYFFLITFALLEVARLFFHTFAEAVFGGASGLIGVPKPSPLGFGRWAIAFESKVALYWLVLVMWAVVAAAMVRLDHARIGKVLNAVRQAPSLAESVGVATFRYKLLAFCLASIVAAVAGSFFAHSRTVVHSTDFGPGAILRLVTFVVIGGIGSVWGPVVGTIGLSIVSEFLRDLGAYETLVYGAVLILTMRFLPEGVVGTLMPAASTADMAKAEDEGAALPDKRHA
jgi:branched-chain amino acid transport system permease protein